MKEILAAIAGAIATVLITSWMQAPSEADGLQVKHSWLDLSIDLPRLDLDSRKTLDAQLSAIFKTDQLSGLYETLQTKTNLTINKLEIVNNAEQRSKPLEIYLKSPGLTYVSPSPDGEPSLRKQPSGNTNAPLKVGALNPEQRYTVWYFGDSLFRSRAPSATVLVDGRRLPVEVTQFDDLMADFGPVAFMRRHELIASMALLVAAFTLILFPIGITAHFHFPFAAFLADRATIARDVRFLEWLRINKPDMLPLTAGTSITAPPPGSSPPGASSP